MLSTVLSSDIAIEISLKIMDAFVDMRKFILSNAQVFQRLDSLEAYKIESSHKIDTLFSLMDKYKIEDKQGIFYQGQIFDANHIGASLKDLGKKCFAFTKLEDAKSVIKEVLQRI